MSTQFRPPALQWAGRHLGLAGALLGEHPNYRGFWMLDEPRLGPARQLLMAPFRPAAVDALDRRISETCRVVLQERRGKRTDGLDVADYSNDVLFRLMAHLLGARTDASPAMASTFRRWMHVFNTSPSLASLRWQPGIYATIARMIRGHDGRPGILADVQSALRRRDTLGGRRPATMADYVGLVWALIAAGTDTPGTVAAQSVWFAVLDGSFPDLTTRPAAGRAVAEALRYYPPFTRPLARWTQEYGIAPGAVARPGEWVELHLPAMNRDPAFFAMPDVYDPDRRDAASARTFGGGAHRCIGNHYGTRVAEHIVVTLAGLAPTLAPIPGYPYRRHAGLLHRLDHLPMRT